MAWDMGISDFPQFHSGHLYKWDQRGARQIPCIPTWDMAILTQEITRLKSPKGLTVREQPKNWGLRVLICSAANPCTSPKSTPVELPFTRTLLCRCPTRGRRWSKPEDTRHNLPKGWELEMKSDLLLGPLLNMETTMGKPKGQKVGFGQVRTGMCHFYSCQKIPFLEKWPCVSISWGKCNRGKLASAEIVSHPKGINSSLTAHRVATGRSSSLQVAFWYQRWCLSGN